MNEQKQRRAPLTAAVKMAVASLAAAGAVLGLAPGVARAQDYIQQMKGTAGNVSFGQTMATDGTTLVVGDPEADYVSGTTCVQGFGSVSIYKLTAGTWQLSQSVIRSMASPTDPNDGYTVNFGSSVSLKNNVLVVGSPGEDDGEGAFYVYRRTSPTAPFNYVTQFVHPSQADDEAHYTLYGGVVTNGTYIAAAEGQASADRGNINFYQIQGNTVTYVSNVTTAPIPGNIAVSALALTTSNALVVTTEGDPGGPQTPLAFQLTATGGSPITNMATTFESGSDITPSMTGDGNTIVVMKVAIQANGPGIFYPQVIKFGAAGVVSHQSMSLPHAYAEYSNIVGSNIGAGTIVMKDNQGFFIGYQDIPGEFGSASFLAGYKYLASTGDYYPAGVVRNDLFHDPYTSFGAAVAYDGTYLYMGDPTQTWTASNTCGQSAVGAVDVLRPLTAVPTGPGAAKELEPWLSESTLNMGQSVATNGTYVLAGAAEDPDATMDSGEVTLFGDFTNQWQEIQRYTDPNGDLYGNFAEAAFGTSVDVDASFFAIGAPLAETGASGLQTGAVYLGAAPPFPVGPTLTELNPPAGVPAGTYFGQSVGLAGTTLVVGAPASLSVGGTGPATRGVVYVYIFQTTTRSWVLTQTLHPSTTDSDYENFGATVDIDPSATYIIVGIPNRAGTGAATQGAVQIFNLVNGSYVSGGEFLAPSNFPPRSNLGTAVSIGASYAVAGSAVAGAVMVLRRTGTTTWVQDTLIQPFTFNFGVALALDGTRFAVGSPSEGKVYRYERINNVWTRTGTLTSTSGSGSFGWSLDTKNGMLAIGDDFALTGTTTTPSGAAYVISLTGF